jgi:hypothetical protein
MTLQPSTTILLPSSTATTVLPSSAYIEAGVGRVGAKYRNLFKQEGKSPQASSFNINQ